MIFIAVACSDNTETVTPSPTPPPKSITINIGFIVDLTGVAAIPHASSYACYAFQDIIKYYSDNHILPGIKFAGFIYDNQYDTARDLPGYQHLMSQDVDLIYALTPPTQAILKPYLDNDEMVLFTHLVSEEGVNPPGYVFGFGSLPQYEIMNLLSWIAENEWDWETKGPAKIGAAIWDFSYTKSLVGGIQTYCDSHPEQFELVDTFLTDIKWSWENEIEAFKDCDYLLPPLPPHSFIRDFNDRGYNTAYIGTDAYVSFLDMIKRQDTIEEIDDMLIIKHYPLLSEDGEFGALVNAVAGKSGQRSEWPQEISFQLAYISTIHDMYIILNAIEHSITEYGYESFNSQMLYNALQTFSIEIDGCSHSFSETKRTSNDNLGIYRVDTVNKTLVRADADWVPIVTEP